MLPSKWLALLFVALAAALAFTSPAGAQAAGEMCELDLRIDQSVQWRGPYGRGYEVLSAAPSLEAVLVRITHRGPPCRFYLTATPARGGDQVLVGPQGTLNYELLADPNGPSILSAEYFGTTASQLPGEFDRSGERTVPLYVTVPVGQFVAGGTYRGQAALRAFRIEADGPALAAEAAIPIQVPVASVMEVRSESFGPQQRTLAVDLGSLDRERREMIDFHLLTNASVTVRVESVNGGVLAHEAGAPSIPYTLQLNGQQLQLRQPAIERIQGVGNNFISVPIQITVEAPDGPRAAGRYRDMLTLVFQTD